MAGTTWAIYKAGGELPAEIQQLCEALDTHDHLLSEPLGGAISNAFLDTAYTHAVDIAALQG
jgi:hypothetical protein